MRRLLVILCLMTVGPLMAAEVKLAWDPMPAGESWTHVRAYERSGAAPNYTYVRVGEVAAPLAEMNIANVVPGQHTYIVRSFNSTWESGDSNSVGTPAVPGAPGRVTITITITVTP